MTTNCGSRESDRVAIRAQLELACAYTESGNKGAARRVLEELASWCDEALGADDELTRGVHAALHSARLPVDVVPEHTDAHVEDAAPVRGAADDRGSAPYEGHYVAAKGSWPCPWVFVADGLFPDARRFGPPRLVADRDATFAKLSLRAASFRYPESIEVIGTETSVDESAEQWTVTSPRPRPPAVAEESSAPSENTEQRCVVVRVLGPVEVAGWLELPDRAIVTEIVCYLALHDEAIPAGDLRLALRPDDATGIAPETFRSHLSYVRRALGPELFPQAGPNGYRLGAGVTTDWSRFRELAAREEVDELTEALRLVRGRPFTGAASSTYRWARTEGIEGQFEAAIRGVSQRLARLARACGDAELAAWAARRARLV